MWMGEAAVPIAWWVVVSLGLYICSIPVYVGIRGWFLARILHRGLEAKERTQIGKESLCWPFVITATFADVIFSGPHGPGATAFSEVYEVLGEATGKLLIGEDNHGKDD